MRNNPFVFLIAAGALLFSCSRSIPDTDYTACVNPFVGTDGHGHTFPAAVYPFGMVQAGPDTRLSGWDGCSGYHYSDSLIYGFTHTHLSGTGCLDYGDVLLMPVAGDGGKVPSAFSHANEQASPGYYSVYLDDPKVNVRIAAGRRMAMHEYRYDSASEPRYVVMDLHHRDRLLECRLEQAGDNVIQGWRRSRAWAKSQDVYFYAQFSEPVSVSEFADSAFVRLGFGASDAPLKVKIAISSVSCANAKANLLDEKAEDDWDFDSLREGSVKAWNEWLSRIKVDTDEKTARTFYSAMYHCAIHPTLYSDVNGEYRGMDRQVHKAQGYEQYTVFSVWDVFRAAFPLYCMVARDKMPDFLKSMLAIFNECGKLPRWELSGNETDCMIGFNSASIIADAWTKGLIPRAQLPEYYNAMKLTAERFGDGHDEFCEYGYVPADLCGASVSKTLEYAYDNFCVAQVAGALGNQAGMDLYGARAFYWKNLFDSSIAFMRPRDSDGGWSEGFDPDRVSGFFTEANSWQYTFFVPHDIYGQIEAMGGNEKFCARIDSLFAAESSGEGAELVDVTGLVGQYAHGNEPSHHVAYLYDYAGQPWNTQYMTRHLCDIFYSDGPDGLCGNEDCGQMSAWYVLSAIGMYCVTPGTSAMALTSPVVDKAVVDCGGKEFTVVAEANDAANVYFNSVKLNSRTLSCPFIDFDDILSGGELHYMMSACPDQEKK